VHGVQGRARLRIGPPDGQVEHPTAADGGQLVPVPHHCEASAGLIGDHQQRAGGVLVEHPRLVDDQQIPWRQRGDGNRAGVDTARRRVGVTRTEAGPSAGVVPPPAVLVRQPRRRPGLRTQLRRLSLGGLQGRGDHDQPVTLHAELPPRLGQHRRLSRPSRTLHDRQRRRTGEHGDRLELSLIQTVIPDLDDVPGPGGFGAADGEPAGEVGLDVQHLRRG
jgi:hypothetical protein